MFEAKVKIKNSETSTTKKFLCYEEIVLSTQSQILRDMVEETKQGFQGDIEDVTITIKMVW